MLLMAASVFVSLRCPCSFQDIDFFQHLEMHMRSEQPSLCGRDHLSYRSYYFPVKVRPLSNSTARIPHRTIKCRKLWLDAARNSMGNNRLVPSSQYARGGQGRLAVAIVSVFNHPGWYLWFQTRIVSSISAGVRERGVSLANVNWIYLADTRGHARYDPYIIRGTI